MGAERCLRPIDHDSSPADLHAAPMTSTWWSHDASRLLRQQAPVSQIHTRLQNIRFGSIGVDPAMELSVVPL
jgi:hypothetical protein